MFKCYKGFFNNINWSSISNEPLYDENGVYVFGNEDGGVGLDRNGKDNGTWEYIGGDKSNLNNYKFY